MLLYAENNSNQLIEITVNNTSVNDYVITRYYLDNVLPGKKSVNALDFFSSSLKDNNITEVEKIEFNFKISDENYHTLYESDKIIINIK